MSNSVSGIITETLASFRIRSALESTVRHASFRRYRMIVRVHGISAKRLAVIRDALSERLGIPVIVSFGKGILCVDIPLEKTPEIPFGRVLNSIPGYGMQLPIAIGKDCRDKVMDLFRMPHLLIAGMDGYGKSSFIDVAVSSMTSARTPDEVRFVLIGSDRHADSPYSSGIVRTDCELEEMMEAALDKLAERYWILADAGCRNIAEYNRKNSSGMPFIVFIADEADSLIDRCRFSGFLASFSAKARSAGMHFIASFSDTETAASLNLFFGTRIAFRLDDPYFSKLLVGTDDAVYLHNQGDLIMMQGWGGIPRRFQGYEYTS